MRWKPLTEFPDARAAKLANLRRAARAGLRVPQTFWCTAERPATALPFALAPGPVIVRSASPAEDTAQSTAAGRFESVAVRELGPDGRPAPAAFAAAVARVADSVLEAGAGYLFVQALLTPERGGVAFFDGFYWERTTAPGGNLELTAGTARGNVERGHLDRDDPWSTFLERTARAFAPELRSGAALDLEFAADGAAFTLLQARPARFPVRRNPTLSLANHREILGDPPSPWIVAALERAGADALEYFAEIDGEVRTWNETYAVTAAGRAWLNFAFFFRLMDRWGLPRAFVTDGVGGDPGPPADRRPVLARLLRRSPRLLALQVKNLRTMTRAGRELERLDLAIAEARGLKGLFEATVLGLSIALRTNFAINGALTGAAQVRGALRLRGRAEVVTERMMREYERLRLLDPSALEPALDRWLEDFGHRGPLESDPLQPRFRELRSSLRDDLLRRDAQPAPAPAEPARSRGAKGPLYAIDRRREQFRDDLMRSWERLRAGILAAAAERVDGGELDAIEDAFFLPVEALERSGALQSAVSAGRAAFAAAAALELPATAGLDDIQDVARAAETPTGSSSTELLTGPLTGIALGTRDFEGRVRRASRLMDVLDAAAAPLDAGTVLVVPALEPSWGLVFGRVGAVVTEIGGELSHASILLREARVPAIVNCAGAARLRDGERVKLDTAHGLVIRLDD